jgi:CheY-like chemotaxis protein
VQSAASILIVDDHDGFRTFARGMLEAAGSSVTCTTGRSSGWSR